MASPPTADPSTGGRLFTLPFIGLFLTELAYFTAAGMLIPLTPLFAAGPLGADEVGVGVSFGAFSVTALLLRPIAGREADRRGRRPLLIAGALLAAAAIAAHSVTGDLAVLIALRLVLGIAEAFFFVAGFAMLADMAPPGRTGEALSFNSLALYLGIALGPLVGESLLAASGFTLAWFVAAAIALLAGGVAVAIPERWNPSPEVGPLRLIHRGALLPSALLFSGVAGMAGFLAFAALYARDVGLGGSQLVLLVFGFVVIGCRVIFAKLPDRIPPFRLGGAALALIALGLVLMGVLRSAEGLLVSSAVTAVGVAFITPAFFRAIMSDIPPHERGAASSTASIFLDLAFGGGPMILGVVAGAAGIPVALGVAAGVASAGALAAAAAAVARRPRLATSS